jgi:putative colanic acid biosynthesis acetyltransferase WcaF
MLVRAAWLLACGAFLQTWLPWPSSWKCRLLRAFGAQVGHAVVIKPRVTIKYPWHVAIGDHAWIGEGVWLDSLARIEIGAHACLSQDAMIETGNHDWNAPSFDLIVRAVTIGEGAWVAARALVLPGATLAPDAVLTAGSTLGGTTEAGGIYSGVPARRVGTRVIKCSPPSQ